MKRFMFPVLAVVLTLTLLAGCTTAPEQDDQFSNGEHITIKISHEFASTHPGDKGLQEFKRIVEEETDGMVEVDIYSGGVLGGDVELIQQVTGGQLDAALIYGLALWQGIDPRSAIEEVPFLFSDAQMAHRAYDGAFGEKVTKEILEPTGVKVLAYWENGFRHFTNNVRPIVTPADMVGIKFRSAESPLRIRMFEELGSSAIPIPFPEVYTALQQGITDGQENPLATIETSKFYEVQKYLSLCGHIYSVAPFIINTDIWEGYPDDVKDIIMAAAKEAGKLQRQLVSEGDEEYIKIMENAGIKVNEADKGAFKEAVQPVWEIFKEEHGPDLIDAVLEFE